MHGLDDLFEFLRIPSVSADAERTSDVAAAADWLADFVRRCGGRSEVVKRGPHPLVIGEVGPSSAAGDVPTVMVYGHYDVQPPGRAEDWLSPPFEPEVRDGWIYGRGASDDKGNLYLLLKAIEQLQGDGALPVRIRLVCDGEEESVGDSVVDFIRADEEPIDACVIFDAPMLQRGTPVFTLGARGLLYYHLSLRAGERELHSGTFGGFALNALHAVLEGLGSLVAVPEELHAGTEHPSISALQEWHELLDGAKALEAAGGRLAPGATSSDYYRRTFASCSVEVHGISGGEAELCATSIPVEATANFSIRLAPGQDPDAIATSVERLVKESVPAGCDLTLERLAGSPGCLLPTDGPALGLASDAFERVMGVRPLRLPEGGTLPVLAALAQRSVPTIVSGFGLPESNMHAPNERFLLDYVDLGVSVACETLTALGSISPSG